MNEVRWSEKDLRSMIKELAKDKYGEIKLQHWIKEAVKYQGKYRPVVAVKIAALFNSHILPQKPWETIELAYRYRS